MKPVFEMLLKAIMNPKRALEVFRYHILKVVGNKQYRRFIVLSRPRSGTNLLNSLMNSHPQIHVAGELFSRLNGRDYKKILARAFSKQPAYIEAKGFKIFYSHPLDDTSSGIWDDLQSSDDLYIIHLKRRNILRSLLSNKIAEMQDVWRVTSDRQHNRISQEKISVTFTVEELKKGFEQTKEWQEAADKMFKKHPVLSIEYEELVNNRSNTFQQVTEFLGVHYLKPKTTLRKINVRSMRDMITNYDELKLAFSQTEWSDFFED